jgi:hypothetical protein
MDARKYIELRNETTIEIVSLGYTNVRLFHADALVDAQVGYSVTESGESLTGDKEGDWLPSWFVIGGEDLCGDPLFVDLANPDLPVVTAPHGEGDWHPVTIASSFNGFVAALEEVRVLSEGRENPMKLKNNPILSFQREQTLMAIAEANPNNSLEFWEKWLDANIHDG